MSSPTLGGTPCPSFSSLSSFQQNSSDEPKGMNIMPYNRDEFAGKRILVTGGTKGIGEAAVNRLRRGGGAVLATARNIPPGENPEQFIQADVSTRAGADHVIKTTLE